MLFEIRVNGLILNLGRLFFGRVLVSRNLILRD